MNISSWFSKEKKIILIIFQCLQQKIFSISKKNNLVISFVTKKKIGNSVKRNRIRRRLKAITVKILKIKGAINLNYIYIIICKTKSFSEKYDKLFLEMQKSFKKIIMNRILINIFIFFINIINIYFLLYWEIDVDFYPHVQIILLKV